MHFGCVTKGSAHAARCAFWLVASSCAVACTGNIDGRLAEPGDSFAPNGAAGRGGSSANGAGAANGGAGSGASSGAGSGGGGSSGGSAPGEELPSPSTRAARLTHLQYENTLKDLLHVDDVAGLIGDLRPDPATAGFLFDNDSVALSVDGTLFDGYQRIASTLAQRVVDDPGLLAQATDGTSDAEGFVRSFGLRAQRRPLTDDELSEYVALHAMGATLDPARSPFDAGVRLVIEAMLQSPSFLYRVETSATEANGVIPLDDYEVASRLSYALWNTMPDAALFDAAAEGILTDADGAAEQATRMLDDPRAQAMVTHFHDQLFEAEDFANIHPSESAFPEISPDLGAYALEEHERFVRDVVFDRDGDYTELLTSRNTFVNADLADIYGLSGTFTDAFVPATLDDSRRGILTHVGFLAANATSTAPDPIHRGVFIARKIACLPLAAPPANIPPLPPAEGRTNRETIEAHTQQPGTVCSMCHAPIINPLGFPFESFDAVGAFRTTDNGHPVDTTSNAPVGSENVDVANASELADALAASVDVHSCYTKHWIELLHGRASTSEDSALQERLGAASQRGELSIRGLIAALVTSPAFLTRSSEELE